MASLFASNLHPDCTEATLFKKFSPAGKILNIHICRKGTNGNSHGYGYINFADKDVAENVLQTMNYEPIKGQPVRLMWAHSGLQKFNPSANIFIKNLHESIDENELHDIFAKYGTILSSKVATNKYGHSKGIAYVQFEEEESAGKAIMDVNDKLIKGQKVIVCKFLPKSKREENFNNIYVKPLDLDFTDQDLSELCGKFGSIVSAKVMRDEKGKSKGFGFVCFENSICAKAAVEELNGALLYGKKLFVGRAKTKIERQNELMDNFWQKLRSAKY